MIPTWAIVLDYILGTIMWTLIGRAFMNIFQKEDSTFFFMRVFVKYTNPIINLFKFITPSFLFGPFIALFLIIWSIKSIKTKQVFPFLINEKFLLIFSFSLLSYWIFRMFYGFPIS